MLQATLRFLPDREGDTADGWAVDLGDESEVPTRTYYATITAAQAAIRTAFQADAGIDGYFTQAAEGEVLATNAAAVASAKTALLTAEGL